MTTDALETTQLGKRYSRTKWGLQDCTIRIPSARVTGLVGPNGAGKTTLLQLTAGLLTPTTGSVRVLGRCPQREAHDVLPDLGYVAQDHPLYDQFRVADMLRMGRAVNVRWNGSGFAARMEMLRIPLARRVGTLSRGQRAQVALGMALAKEPRLLLLDEPVASLDPLARQEFLETLSEAASQNNLSVVLSSHLIEDVKRVCNFLVLLSESRVQLTGDIDQLLEEHWLVNADTHPTALMEMGQTVVGRTTRGPQAELVVRGNERRDRSGCDSQPVSLEALILAYMNPLNDTMRASIDAGVCEGRGPG